jgi:hypothetical protein
MASSRRACSDSALSVPAGPCGIRNSARHEQQVIGSALVCGNGEVSSPVPTDPKNALFAGVSGTLISVPSSDPARSGRLFPMLTAPGAPARLSRGPGPAVPTARNDHAAQPETEADLNHFALKALALRPTSLTQTS